MNRDQSNQSVYRGSSESLYPQTKPEMSNEGDVRNSLAAQSFKANMTIPKQMNGNYYGLEFSGIEIDTMTLDTLRDNFIKFLPEDAPGDQGDRLEPAFMKQQYEKLGLNRQNPSMYSMIQWMTEEYEKSEQAGDGLSFDDFI